MTLPDRLPARQLLLGSTGTDVQRLYNYLQRFGYFPNEGLAEYRTWQPAVAAAIADEQSFDETLEQAVRLFQKQSGLVSDGVVGPKTLGLMGRRRCGVPDLVPGEGPQPFVVSGSHWDKSTITYRFENSGSDLQATDAQAAVKAAFQRWSAVVPLTFQEVTTGGDILIGWFSGEHGDGKTNAFDGPSGVLAHCFSPPPGGGSFAGDLHFDEAETWTTDTPASGTDLLTVALHEIGHGIGLDHSADPAAVMYAYYGGIRRELTVDDIAGIRQIYGGKGWAPDWFPLPGKAVFDRDKQQIAAVSRAPGNLDLFVIGFDNHIWSTYWNDRTGWAPDWFPLPGNAVFDRDKQQLAAVSRAPGNLDLFVIGFDNHIWSTYWNDRTGWAPDWFPLPGNAVFDRDKQQLAAVSRAPGNLDLFVIGFDNHIWSTYWNDRTGWAPDWFPLPGNAVFDRDKQQLAAVSRAPGNLDLFVIGFDNHIWSTYWNS
ncbi:matrilysin family metalloendoprotease [Frankia tisae]|uniref:matrilysin family metalloendoprotease n=1 Tax=Frankia tisae TaxID=2950104 RepID=UPI0021C1F434|nr:matrilysin family metalloendoprotease [Frankia tisae]